MFRPSIWLLVGACAFFMCSAAWAVVIRHDKPDERYQADEGMFPQLADMPGVGHGALIAPQWVVTAAHTIQGEIKEIMIAGQARKVERVIIHPGYRGLPEIMVERALAANDATEAMEFLAANHDIALIRLSDPVSDVEPVGIYTGQGEMGRTVQLLGKGATGTGLTGVLPDSPQRGTLRRAFNRISKVDDRWIAYTFDKGRRAHRLEGMSGSGDSGGPVLIKVKGRWMLAGLTSWQGGNPDLRLPASVYGQQTYSVRLSFYVDWIEEILSDSAEGLRESL